MTLYEQWISGAYTRDGRTNDKLWDDYLPKEQKIYEYILDNKLTTLDGTVKEFSEKFDIPLTYVTGFIDGINDIQPTPLEVEDLKSLTEDSNISVVIDFPVLFKKMVEYKADHLYTLEQWNNIFSDEELKSFYKEQKKSTTYVSENSKVGRNDPCPCGSGFKFKKCCGK